MTADPKRPPPLPTGKSAMFPPPLPEARRTPRDPYSSDLAAYVATPSDPPKIIPRPGQPLQTDLKSLTSRVDRLETGLEAHIRDSGQKYVALADAISEMRKEDTRRTENLANGLMSLDGKVLGLQRMMDAAIQHLTHRHSIHDVTDEKLSKKSDALAQNDANQWARIEVLWSRVEILFKALAWKFVITTVIVWVLSHLLARFGL